MIGIVRHLRANVVAYIALFVALGGTSYAAFTLPANSVGKRQIKNGAVTPSKLNAAAFPAYIRYWAIVGPGGRLLAHYPRAIRLSYDASTAGGVLALGRGPSGSFGGPFASGCFPMATAGGAGAFVQAGSRADVPTHGPKGVWIGFETLSGTDSAHGGVGIGAYDDQATVYIAVLCPHP